MKLETARGDGWIVSRGDFRPPFLGVLRNGNSIRRCCVVSYTTIPDAIKAADAEGMNRIINSKGLVAKKSGNSTGDGTRGGKL